MPDAGFGGEVAEAKVGQATKQPAAAPAARKSRRFIGQDASIFQRLRFKMPVQEIVDSAIHIDDLERQVQFGIPFNEGYLDAMCSRWWEYE